MILLRLITLVLAVALLYILATQVLIPVFTGRKLFPAFRKSELSQKVTATRDTVSELREQTQNLSELEVLLAKKKELEGKISSLENPPADAASPTTPKE